MLLHSEHLYALSMLFVRHRASFCFRFEDSYSGSNVVIFFFFFSEYTQQSVKSRQLLVLAYQRSVILTITDLIGILPNCQISTATFIGTPVFQLWTWNM